MGPCQAKGEKPKRPLSNATPDAGEYNIDEYMYAEPDNQPQKEIFPQGKTESKPLKSWEKRRMMINPADYQYSNKVNTLLLKTPGYLSTLRVSVLSVSVGR
jgi:hypothetical protein